MFIFRSKQAKANEALLNYAARGDGFTSAIAEHLEKNKTLVNLETQDKAGNTALLLSIDAHATVNTRVLMAAGAKLDTANKNGDTPLMAALAKDMPHIVRALIAAGADVTAKNKQGLSAADITAQSKSPEILSFLPYLKGQKPLEELKAQIAQQAPDARVIDAAKDYVVKALENALAEGGSVNAVDRNGISALAWVAANNNRAGVDLLLKKGATVDLQPVGAKSPTPLMAAAARGSDAAIELLLKAGAKTDIVTESGKTAFDLALASPSPKGAVLIAEAELARAKTDAEKAAADKKKATAELALGLHDNNPFLALDALKRGADVNAEVANGYTLVTRAALGDNKTLALLLDAGADVNKADAQGRVPIVVAAGAKNGLAVREFIKHGADVNKQDAEKETALSRLMIGEDHKTLDALIDAKADPTVKGRYNHTVLETLARWEGSTALIKRFGENKVDMNGKNADGLSPLMMAVQATWKDNAVAFIAAGADVLAKNNKGESVLDMVKKNGWQDIATQIEAVQKAQAAPVAIPATVPATQAPKP